MSKTMENLCITIGAKGKSFFSKIRSEERGASDMVAVIAIIVIVLAVAVIFKDQLIGVVNAAFSNVTTWIGTGTTDGAGNP